MTDSAISRVAQKVLDAYGAELLRSDKPLIQCHPLAAALRAAADQVVPVELHPQIYEDCCQYSDVQTRAGIRAALLAIAAELEGQL
jgi:hypothetical protein